MDSKKVYCVDCKYFLEEYWDTEPIDFTIGGTGEYYPNRCSYFEPSQKVNLIEKKCSYFKARLTPCQYYESIGMLILLSLMQVCTFSSPENNTELHPVTSFLSIALLITYFVLHIGHFIYIKLKYR